MQKCSTSSQEFNLSGPFSLPPLAFSWLAWKRRVPSGPTIYPAADRVFPGGMPFTVTCSFQRPRWEQPSQTFSINKGRKKKKSEKKKSIYRLLTASDKIPAKTRRGANKGQINEQPGRAGPGLLNLEAAAIAPFLTSQRARAKNCIKGSPVWAFEQGRLARRRADTARNLAERQQNTGHLKANLTTGIRHLHTTTTKKTLPV